LLRGLRLIGVSREEVWNIVAATRLSKLADVGAEVKKREGRDAWYVRVATDMLAAGRKELKDAIAEIVKTAAGRMPTRLKAGWRSWRKGGTHSRELAEVQGACV
jgi:hypothetical protein